jgi:hypothetical protein
MYFFVDTLADSYVLKTAEVSGFALACKRQHSKYSSIISTNYFYGSVWLASRKHLLQLYV